MRRAFAVVFSFALFASVLTGRPDSSQGLSVAEARADEASASDCVGFVKTDLDKGFEYAINNACSRKLACTVSWTVSCEDTEGRVTSSKKEKSTLALAADGSASVTASATSCKQGWRIDSVAWSCNESK